MGGRQVSYGNLTLTDIRVLERVLAEYRGRTLRFLEIGMNTGATARGIRDFCVEADIFLQYTGIDDGTLHHAVEHPFDGAYFIRGKSSEVFHLVGEQDVIFVDGAHTRNDVVLDTVNYVPKVAPGGFLMFHDTSPEIQHTMREAYGPDIPQFYNAVNEALDLIRWPWEGWRYWAHDYERGQKHGGITVFQLQR